MKSADMIIAELDLLELEFTMLIEKYEHYTVTPDVYRNLLLCLEAIKVKEGELDRKGANVILPAMSYVSYAALNAAASSI